jgi:hypothetical protein
MPAIKQQEYPKRRFVAMSFVTIKSPGVPSLMRSTKLEPVINDATLRVNWSLLSVQDSHPFFLA